MPEGSRRYLDVRPFGADRTPPTITAPAHVAFRDGSYSDVGASVDGRVADIHVQVGQRVARGDALVSIVSAEAATLRGELARYDVLRSAAEREVERQRSMVERGVGMPSELAAAEARLAENEATLAGLRTTARALGRGRGATSVVRAPIDGVVLARHTNVGAAVESGESLLVTIGDPDATWIVAEVFERDLALVAVSAQVRVELSTTGAPRTGRVSAVGGAVDPSTRRAPVYVSLDAAEESPLRAGMYARARIASSVPGTGALPASAVLVKGERTVVYVAQDAHSFIEREVQIGHPSRGSVPILGGLRAGENIVVRGALLIDGAAEILR